jgi:hypothetical protein
MSITNVEHVKNGMLFLITKNISVDVLVFRCLAETMFNLILGKSDMKNSALAKRIVLLLSCSTPEAKSSKAIEQSLKAVVVGETNAYMDKDYPKWSSYWDHSEDVLRLDISEAGFTQTKGWYKSGENLELFFEENPEPITSTFKNSNYLNIS